MREDSLDLAANQDASQPSPSVRGHEDHITSSLNRRVDDSEIRCRLDARHARARHSHGLGSQLDLPQMLTRLTFRALVKIIRRLDGDIGEWRIRVERQAGICRDARADRLRQIDRAIDSLPRQRRPVGGYQDVLEHGRLLRSRLSTSIVVTGCVAVGTVLPGVTLNAGAWIAAA